MWDVLIFKVLPRKKFPSDSQLLLMGSAESTEVHYACLLDPCNLVQVFLYSLHLLPYREANFFGAFFAFFKIPRTEHPAQGGRGVLEEALLDCSQERVNLEGAARFNVKI